MSREKSLFRQSIIFSTYLIMLLWLVKSVEWAFTTSFAHFGILPRSLHGMVGVIASPFIHGDFLHLISNSFSLMTLVIILFFFYDKVALRALLFIYLITGVGVWILAREAYHIGASGVIYGIASFILFSGLLRKNQSSLALSFIILLLYGGMFYGVLPQQGHISWESHLMGLVSGLIVALFFKNEFAGQADMELHFEKINFDDEDDEDFDYSSGYFTKDGHLVSYQYEYNPQKPASGEVNKAVKPQKQQTYIYHYSGNSTND